MSDKHKIVQTGCSICQKHFGTVEQFKRHIAAQIARAGLVAIVPSNVRHSVKALTDGRAIIVDYPLRRDFD